MVLELGTLVRPRSHNPLINGRLLKVCHKMGKGWEGEEVYQLTFLESDLGQPHALIGPFKESEIAVEEVKIE